MSGLDYTLSRYTDWLNGETEIDLEKLLGELTETELSEFNELKVVVDMLISMKTSERFEELFDKINSKREEIYSFSQASGFRTESDDIDDEDIDLVNKAFDEEFDDE